MKVLSGVSALVVLVCGVLLRPGAGEEIRGAGSGTVCDARGASIQLGAPEDLLRRSMGEMEGMADFFPFVPRLAAGNDGVLLVLSAPSGAPAGWPGGLSIQARELRDGEWGPVETVAAGAGVMRWQAEAAGSSGRRWLTWWFEEDVDDPVSSIRLVGSSRGETPWTAAERLTDGQAMDLPDFLPSVVFDSTGEPLTVWVDGREERVMTGDLAHPRRHVTKAFARSFDAPFEQTAERVTPEGEYVVGYVAPVRVKHPSNPAVLYFKSSLAAKRPTWLGSGRGIYSVEREKSGTWSKPARFLVSPADAGTSEIGLLQAFGLADGRISVVFPAISESINWTADPQSSELRIVTRDRKSKGTSGVLAHGVSYGSAQTQSVRGDVALDGTIAVAYQRVIGPALSDETSLMLLITDGRECVASATISEHIPAQPLFDVAVDGNGRIHVVWAELGEGKQVILKHRAATVLRRT